VSLVTLLERGALGSVQLGRSRTAIVEQLGQPADQSVLRPLILKWPSLEVTFDSQERAILIAVEMPASEALPPEVRTDLEQLNGRTQTEVLALIESSGLTWSADPALSRDEGVAVRPSSSPCVLMFEGDVLREVYIAPRG
jgi:hypothetical protein